MIKYLAVVGGWALLYPQLSSLLASVTANKEIYLGSIDQ